MGRKEKVSASLKLEAIDAYLSGQKIIAEISLHLQVNKSSVRRWVHKYKLGGPHKIDIPKTNKVYSEMLKVSAVTDYLDRNMSQSQVCDKYEISSTSILYGWIKKYNNHGKMTPKKNIGELTMIKGRKTTYEEKLAIVAYCIENNDDYYMASNKYEVSYQQVYSWVKKYKQDGKESLIDHRGQRIAKEPLTESEKLTEQLRLLEAENKRLKMENDFFKKLEEIERSRLIKGLNKKRNI